jgi:hypothetical protein
MFAWVTSLVSKNEQTVDSLVVGGLISLVAMIIFQGYQLFLDIHTYSPSSFAGGAASIILAGGGAKAARDHWSTDDPSIPPPSALTPSNGTH